MNSFKLLHPKLREIIRKHGYFNPTEIQERAIPLILKGYNTLIISPTGTGKTEAALFPILSKLLELKERGVALKGIYAIYITPLRALNRDILRRMHAMAKEVGFEMAIRHGDTPQSLRRRMALSPPQILITTPETLQFLLIGRRLRGCLISIRWVIIDEVHEMLDNKRGTQLSLSLERLREITVRGFQRIGLSATIGDEGLAKGFLGGNRLVFVVRSTENRPTELSVKYPEGTDQEGRIKLLCEVIRKEKGKVLIFTNTRETAEALGNRLKAIFNDSVGVHHGSLSREERVDKEEGFKVGNVKALVCTSSLELGLDIGEVNLVVQYGSPRQALRLTQRVGRSGHRGNGIAKGLIIALNPDECLEASVIARRALNGELENHDFHFRALDVLAHQLAGMVIERGELSVREAYDIVTRSYAYSDLELGELVKVLRQLEAEGLIKLWNEGRVTARRGLYRYYYEGASTIPDVKKYKVIDITSSRPIGDLDEAFVALNCEEGFTFILSGRAWTVLRVEGNAVYVTPATDVLGALPAWEGELIPVPYSVAREVGSLRRRIGEALLRGKDPKELLKLYPLDEQASNEVVSLIREHLERGYPLPHDKNVVVEVMGRLTVIHTCIGSKANEALGLYLSHYISSRYGLNVAYRKDPYRVLLISNRPLREKWLIRALREMDNVEEEVKEALTSSKLYKWKLVQVAKRFGALRNDAEVKLSEKLVKAFEGSVIAEEALREVLTDNVDLNGLMNLLEGLRRGRLSLRYVNVDEFSPLAKPIVETAYYYDRPLNIIPISSLAEVVKRRIMEERVMLICLHCLWSCTYKIGELPRDLRCFKCGSKYLSAVVPPSDEALNVLKRKVRGAKLNREEERLFKRLQLSARVVLSYGKKGVIALAGRGVGPVTALRILSSSRDEGELLVNIIKAERNYARTKQFWD
ncbi:MAG: hypothetical protein B6U69_00045 [Thermofilum sp. ex4484_15]|nr:MAG: hypothetical protein B6U69_00045 [Thermofilum sp. ex4484_15]